MFSKNIVVDMYMNLDGTCEQPKNKNTEVAQFNIKNTKNYSEVEKSLDWTEKCLAVEGFGILALAAQRTSINQQFKTDHLGEILVFILSQTNLDKSHSAEVLYHSLSDLAIANNCENISIMLKLLTTCWSEHGCESSQ